MNQTVSTILIQWYRSHGRDLPWRHTRDPYAIWLSEVILQQTRIAQGLSYWQRFMHHFPTVERLASATEDEVLLLWQGLGYYSRARHLHEAARQIVAKGGFPTTLREIKSLSGIGDYTAAAIASFAFGVDAAAVDGNVYRVLARVFGIDTPIDTSNGRHLIAALAQDLVPKGHADELNQAIMDFGALQCTPRKARCETCPLLDRCVAAHDGRVEELPVKLKTTTIKERHFTYIFIRCKGQTAIHRRKAGDIWQGLWEPVLIEGTALPQWQGQWTLVCKEVKHQLTHRLIFADFYLFETDSRISLPADYIWIDEAAFNSYAQPQLVKNLVAHIHLHSPSL